MISENIECDICLLEKPFHIQQKMRSGKNKEKAFEQNCVLVFSFIAVIPFSLNDDGFFFLIF